MKLTKQKSSLLAIIMMLSMLFQLIPQKAFAETETVGSHIYTYSDNGDGTATITGFTNEGSTDIFIPENLGGLTVTVIGSGAFSSKGLTGVTIPDSVTSIEDRAFSWNQLVSLTIPASVKSIGNQAFEYNFNTLTSVTFGTGLETIGDSAFLNCKLQSVTIPDSTISIGSDAFSGSTNDISSLTLGSSLETIGDYAFYDQLIETLTIPQSVTNIGIAAFGRNRLYDIIIENSSVAISSNAFINNQTTPDALTITGYTDSTADDYADSFGHTFIALDGGGPDGIATDDQGNTYNYMEDGNGNAIITDFTAGDKLNTSIIIPEIVDGLTVTQIGDGAFYDKSLTHVTIPESVALISEQAFADNHLTDVTIKKAEAVIQENAFANNQEISSALTIHGYKGSTAEVYATEYGHSFDALSIEPQTPPVLEASLNYGSVDVNDDNLYINLTDSNEDWLKSISGVTLSMNGGTETEGIDKWTVCNDKIYYIDNDDYDDFPDSSYVYTNTAWNMNSQMYIRFQMGTAARICKTGTYTVVISADGYDDAEVNFEITHGILHAIKVTDQPSNVISGGNVGLVKAALVDEFDNIVTGVRRYDFSDVSVTAKDSAFTIGGETSASVTDGIASFSNITATKASGLSGAKLGFTFTITPEIDVKDRISRDPITFTCDSEAFNIAALTSDEDRSNAPPQTPITSILVNGERQNEAATTRRETGTDGMITTTVTIHDNKLAGLLDAINKSNNGENPGLNKPVVISIPVSGKNAMVIGELTGTTIKTMEQKEAVLEIKTDSVTYTLPANQINIENIADRIGAGAALSNIKVKVTVAQVPADTVKIVEDTANKNNFQLVVKPVDFNVSCSFGDKTVEVSKFNGYVERMVAIPEGIDPGKITTGIVLNSDGTFSHVPTTVIFVDGKYYAKINSLTNSTYSVIWSPKTFEDVDNHWAKDEINDMGSRLVISGYGNRFNPESNITRAEFAAIVVRALGLLRPGTGTESYTDVKKDAWYYDAVSIANAYGIISGYGNGNFGPEDNITYEQALSIVSRAMKISGLGVELKAGEAETILLGLVDLQATAAYAKNGIAACIKSGIISETNSQWISEPTEYITRAQVAIIIRQLLIKSNLI